MPFLNDEKKKDAALTLLYVVSFAMLLSFGALFMAFGDFILGVILFSAGLLLLSTDEHVHYSRAKKAGHKAHPDFFKSPLSSIVAFIVLAFFIPALISLYLFFFQNFSPDVLIIALAGLVVVCVKLISTSARHFLTK